MKITFDTKNTEEVAEVLALLIKTPAEDNAKVSKNEEKGEAIPEPTKEVEEAPKAPEKKTPTKKQGDKKASVTLQELKDLAKSKVDVSSREVVKGVISEFGDKLTEVKPSDYDALAEKLDALGE